VNEIDDIPIPFPAVVPPPRTIVEFLGDLQILHGFSFNGLLPQETPHGKAMVLCFGTGFGKAAGFDVGIVLHEGSMIDLGDDVTDPASYEAAMVSLHGDSVEHVDSIQDKVGETEFKVIRITFASGRQVKIGGPGGMVLANETPPQETT